MMAVTGLANGNSGQAIAGSTHRQWRRWATQPAQIVRPFYLRKRDLAIEAIAEFFPSDAPYALHESEGALLVALVGWREKNFPRAL
jgi:valine--pyruvate aminotransferase